jgi:hypothetical protein
MDNFWKGAYVDTLKSTLAGEEKMSRKAKLKRACGDH